LVGELLKKAREESGKDLKEISEILKIRYDYLRAIEEGDFKQLPEEVYIKGYIREYAELLHIDPETALSAYVQQTSPPQDDKGEPPTDITSDHKKSKITYILVPLVLVVFGLILFFVLHSPKKEQEISQTPMNTENVKPSPISTEPEETPQMPVEIKEERPYPFSEKKEEVLTPHAPNLKEPLPDTVTPPPNNVNIGKAPHTLKIVATDTVWLLITIDNAAAPEEMILKIGETVTFQAQEGFSLKLGNAGGTKVLFDGKDIGKLGEKGQVVKLNLPDLL
jgi:cytoskeletal protein RodZ